MVFWNISQEFIKSNRLLLISYVFISLLFYGLVIVLIPWMSSRIMQDPDKDIKSIIKKIGYVLLILCPLYAAKLNIEHLLFPKWTKHIRTHLLRLYLDKNKVEFRDVSVTSDIMMLFDISEQSCRIFKWVITTLLPVVLISTVLMFYLLKKDWRLGLLSTLCNIGLVVYLIREIPSVISSYQNSQKQYTSLVSNLDNLYTNLFNIYLNRQVNETIQANDRLEDDYKQYIHTFQSRLIYFTSKFRSIYLLFFVAVCLYLYITSKNDTSFVFLIISVVGFFILRIETITDTMTENISKIGQIITEEVMFKNKNEPKKDISHVNGDLKFENVSFSYESNKVINNVTLHIPKGHRIGILGTAGSGKSTLMKLLLGFHMSFTGTITIDDQSIRELNPDDIRRHIYYINQRTMLFNETLLYNLSYGTSCTKEQVVNLVEKYNFTSIFQDKENADNDWTQRIIYTNGSTISLGMQKVIFLIRGMLHDAPVYLIDEPFTSIDEDTRSKVLHMIDVETKGKTVVIITHDMNQLDTILDSFYTLKK